MNILISLPLLLILLVLALCSFLFSLSETSVISLSKLKLRHMVAKGVRGSRSLQWLVTNSDKFIVSLLVGNNFVNIAFSAIVSGLFIVALGSRWGVLAATFCTTLFILIFCEILPKMLALKNTERMALAVSPVMEWFVKFLNPVGRFFTRVGDLMLSILRIEHPKRSPLVTEEELRLMIEVGKEEGVLTDEERRMLHRIFEFGDTRVEQAMIPLDKMVVVSADSTAEQLLDIFAEEGHARIPVYKGSKDRIIGVVYARDLVYTLRDKGLFAVSDLFHPICRVPASTRTNELLRRFQQEKIQIAVVVDPQDKVLGLVTLEDLIEEIVGEIEERIPGSAK